MTAPNLLCFASQTHVHVSAPPVAAIILALLSVDFVNVFSGALIVRTLDNQ